MVKRLEDLDVNAELTDRERREVEKDAFLLTTEEAEMLLQSLYAFDKVSAQHTAQYSPEEIDTEEVRKKLEAPEEQQKLKQDVLEAYKERSLDADKLASIADKILSTPYWSCELIRIEVPSGDEDCIEDYYITAPEEKKGTIEASKREAFRSTDSIKEKAAIVGIPSNLLYVSGLEVIEANIVRKVLGTLSNDIITLDTEIDIIPSSDIYRMPMSKAFRNQQTIMKNGTQKINIGRRGKDPVCIQVIISSKDGKPIEYKPEYRTVQAAIGNLIDDNNGKLPIKVTVSQICRRILGVDSSYYVSKEQCQAVESIMDELLGMPVNIDFRTQLREHKHINKQAGYDYDLDETAQIYGSLIDARKLVKATCNGVDRIKEPTYKITDVPPLYEYSHRIGQIAQIPVKYLNGSISVKEKGLKGTQAQAPRTNINYQTLKIYILEQLKLMQHTQKQSTNHTYSSVIELSGIEKELGGSNITARSKRTIRKNTEAYLDELVKLKEIKAWDIVTGMKGKVDGYKITLPAYSKAPKDIE